MNPKNRKLKINTKNKAYLHKDSPLFNIRTKKKLADILFSDLSQLKQLALSDSEYNQFEQKNKFGKVRKIQHPINTRDLVHTRIASLLCRIKQPSYVQSGVKGLSHVSNAKAHIGNDFVLKTDISAFYESTTRSMIFGFFYNFMKCSSDVADMLASICTVQNHLPTGSRLSMPLAYWANHRMFNSLYSLAMSKNITMTLFVDDITFSSNSNSLTRSFKKNVSEIIKRNGHAVSVGKSISYHAGQVKIITGSALGPNKLLPRNSHIMGVHQDLLLWRLLVREGKLLSSIYSRLMGRLNAISIIDDRYRDISRAIKADREKLQLNMNQ